MHVCFDGLTSQEIFNADILHGANRNLSENELVHAGQLLKLAARLLADVQNVASILCGRAGYRKEYLVNVIFLGCIEDLFTAADDRHTVYVTAFLCGIVVNEAHGHVVGFNGLNQIPLEHLSCCSSANDHNPALDCFVRTLMFCYRNSHPIGEPGGDDQNKLNDPAKHMVGSRHTREIKQPRYYIQQRSER